MNRSRLALVGLLCCLAVPEIVVQAAEQIEARLAGETQHHHLPAPDRDLPAPMEGDEAEWLVVDFDHDEHGSFTLLSEPKLLVEQTSCDAAHGGGFSPRALLNALHRLRL